MFCRVIHKDREKIAGKCFVQFIFYHGVRVLTYSTSTKWGKCHVRLCFITTCVFPPTHLTLRDFELNEITFPSSSYDRSHVFIHKQECVNQLSLILTFSQVTFLSSELTAYFEVKLFYIKDKLLSFNDRMFTQFTRVEFLEPRSFSNVVFLKARVVWLF